MKKVIKKILKPLMPIFYGTPWLYGAYHKTRGIVAATMYGFPSMKMRVIGITGTNGKTTTANMLARILESGGAKVGLATTVNIWTGKKRWTNETKMTTLSPFALQGLLRQMAKQKCTHAIVETTSHALAQHRTWGIFYDVAVFTNITHDHFDFHKDFSHYKTAKGKLFSDLAESLRKPDMPKIAIINLSDPESTYFDSFAADKKYYYGIDNIHTETTPDEMISAQDISLSSAGSRFMVSAPDGKAEINLRLPGKFNVYNALAAAATAHSLGFNIETIKQGLESTWNVPGRMESVPNQRGINIIIDYAHTPDGFLQVFKTVRDTTSGRIIAVFGATGERDKTKRPKLGEIASSFADHIILTEEDPASEDPAQIVREIMPGINKSKFKEGQSLDIIVDRTAAIKRALSIARPNDTVLLLAIGAQTVMAKAEGMVPYQEREVVEEILRAMS